MTDKSRIEARFKNISSSGGWMKLTGPDKYGDKDVVGISMWKWGDGEEALIGGMTIDTDELIRAIRAIEVLTP